MACNALCKKLLEEEYIAIDTEFFSIDNHNRQLSLIQIAASFGNFIIDLDFSKSNQLSGLITLLEDKKLLKIFHAHNQDLEVIYSNLGAMVQNIFDTQIAVMFIRIEESYSYQNLVNEFLNIKLDKTLQNHNWHVRPLTEEQLIYAAHDVSYLKQVYPLIVTKLSNKKRLLWANEYMSKLGISAVRQTKAHQHYHKYNFDLASDELYAKLELIIELLEINAGEFNKKPDEILSAHYLKNLLKAKKLNKVKLDIVLKEAKTKPSDEIIEKILKIIHDDVSKKLLAKVEMPIDLKVELSYEHTHILIILRYLLKKISIKNSIAARLIAEKHDLINLVLKKDSKVNHGWRFDIFGEKAHKILRGESGIYIDKEKFILK